MGQHRSHSATRWITKVTDHTLRIKNLSIALEALSRLKLDVYFSEIEMLLAIAINEAKKEYQ